MHSRQRSRYQPRDRGVTHGSDFTNCRHRPLRSSFLETLVSCSTSWRVSGACARGGGNTSVKLGDHMLVKSSGSVLATIQPRTCRSRRAAVQGTARQRPRAVPATSARLPLIEQCWRPAGSRSGQRPSVESVLHHLMPGRFVVHLHATLVNEFSCCQEGRRLSASNSGRTSSGLTSSTLDCLAKALQEGLRAFEAQPAKSGLAP